eukprot:1350787-Amorphochlora_amoeboformis.AAC.2
MANHESDGGGREAVATGGSKPSSAARMARWSALFMFLVGTVLFIVLGLQESRYGAMEQRVAYLNGFQPADCTVDNAVEGDLEGEMKEGVESLEQAVVAGESTVASPEPKVLSESSTKDKTR